MLLEPVLLEAALAAVFDRVALTFRARIERHKLSVDQIMLIKALHISNMAAEFLVRAAVLHNLVLISKDFLEGTRFIFTLCHVYVLVFAVLFGASSALFSTGTIVLFTAEVGPGSKAMMTSGVAL